MLKASLSFDDKFAEGQGNGEIIWRVWTWDHVNYKVITTRLNRLPFPPPVRRHSNANGSYLPGAFPVHSRLYPQRRLSLLVPWPLHFPPGVGGGVRSHWVTYPTHHLVEVFDVDASGCPCTLLSLCHSQVPTNKRFTSFKPLTIILSGLAEWRTALICTTLPASARQTVVSLCCASLFPWQPQPLAASAMLLGWI